MRDHSRTDPLTSYNRRPVPETPASAVASPLAVAAPLREQARPALPQLALRPLRLLALVAVYAVVVFVFPRPEAVSPEGWRRTGLFLATIAGLMIQPMPGAALVIVSLTLFVLVGGVPASRALA